jgi:hypothetical protein
VKSTIATVTRLSDRRGAYVSPGTVASVLKAARDNLARRGLASPETGSTPNGPLTIVDALRIASGGEYPADLAAREAIGEQVGNFDTWVAFSPDEDRVWAVLRRAERAQS